MVWKDKPELTPAAREATLVKMKACGLCSSSWLGSLFYQAETMGVTPSAPAPVCWFFL